MKKQLLGALLYLLSYSLCGGNTPDQFGRYSFDFSDEQIWTLSQGDGDRLSGVEGVQGAVLQITSDGQKESSWNFNKFPFGQLRQASESGLAKFTFKARCIGSSTLNIISGPGFANKDIEITDQWKLYTVIFPIPAPCQLDSLRLGQWRSVGTIQFAEAKIEPVNASFNQSLGSGEYWNPKTKQYQFKSSFDSLGGAYFSGLILQQCYFNTNRWCFYNDSQLVYKFTAPENQTFYSGQLKFGIGYCKSGTIQAEYSIDGQHWKSSDDSTSDNLNSEKTVLNIENIESHQVYIRFHGINKPSVQLDEFLFVGNCSEKNIADSVADTSADSSADSVVDTAALGCNTEIVDEITGHTVFWTLISGDGFPPQAFFSSIPYSSLPRTSPGLQTCLKNAQWQQDGIKKQAQLYSEYYVPYYYREDFGNRLTFDRPISTPVWWSEATRKIAPMRLPPSVQSSPQPQQKAIHISAAGNDYQSAQLVISPEQTITVSINEISDLTSDQGGKIDKSNVDIRRVFYHLVDNPTDSTGVRDWWPDALVPLTDSIKSAAGINAPLWITVYVPSGTPKGNYSGRIELKLSSSDKTESVNVPISLRVWGFDLPKSNTIETAFGFNFNSAFRYHGIKDEADKRKIADMYMSLLSQYRISIYDPVPLDHFSVTFSVDKQNPSNSKANIDFTRFDIAFQRALDKYHFTGFQLPVQGLRRSSTDPEQFQLNGFLESSPEYQAMFKSQVEQIQKHLDEKNWLNLAYIYWFDEPREADYPFVKRGMEQIKKYAPLLQTMLTEDPSEKTVLDNNMGPVDIWCPLTPRYNAEIAQQLRTKGNRFWTYVCCGPHAPYCTEFIDHPAVELRTWLWQSWQNNTSGILIWQTNYWTSPTAFPDKNKPQNPYLDPMSYVSEYYPIGTKQFWGNGDGRFVYPPVSCADVSKEPCFDAPVPSIRLAMLREGIEDFQMLVLLQNKIEQMTGISNELKSEWLDLLTVPPSITSDWRTFAKTPESLDNQREKIAAAIEQIIELQSQKQASEQ